MEHSCKDHQQHCNRRALPATEHDVNLELSGHAMMLTNPPASHMATDPQTPWFQPPKIPISNLLVLMDTAQNIPMRRGEITPILALKKIREDPRYGLMNRRQFEMLTKRLSEKTRCYGYVISSCLSLLFLFVYRYMDRTYLQVALDFLATSGG